MKINIEIKQLLLGLLIFFLFENLHGQYKIELNCDGYKAVAVQELDTSIDYRDSIVLYTELDKFIYHLRNHGYVTASVDSITLTDSIFQVCIYLGHKYDLGNIRPGNVESWIIAEAGIDWQTLNQSILSAENIAKLMDNILRVLEKKGYPFARISLDSVEVSENTIAARLNLDKRTLIRVDSLQTSGDVEISRSFLSKYLGIEKGEVYDQGKILNISTKLQNLSFLSLSSQPTIRFYEDKAVLLLDLKEERNSKFDFIIGLLPQNENGSQKFNIAFDFTAEMNNKIGAGEYLFAQIRQLKPETQELQLKFTYPYLLDLPFGLDVSLEIYRNAKEFLNLDFDIGWQYYISANNYLKAFWNINSSRLLEVDTERIISSKKLPDQLDYNFNAGGIELRYEKLDYRFNPRKGLEINFRGTAGLKKIVRNLEIESLVGEDYDFSKSYDTLTTNTFQFELGGNINYYLPLAKRATLKISGRAAKILAEENVYENEFFRLGGNKLLRGFDEQSILSDFYTLFILEYRLLIGRNSFVSAFLDNAWVHNSLKETTWEHLFGTGAGLSFETQAGIFAINIAVGKRRDIDLNFRNAKVHFGYLNLF